MLGPRHRHPATNTAIFNYPPTGDTGHRVRPHLDGDPADPLRVHLYRPAWLSSSKVDYVNTEPCSVTPPTPSTWVHFPTCGRGTNGGSTRTRTPATPAALLWNAPRRRLYRLPGHADFATHRGHHFCRTRPVLDGLHRAPKAVPVGGGRDRAPDDMCRLRLGDGNGGRAPRCDQKV